MSRGVASVHGLSLHVFSLTFPTFGVVYLGVREQLTSRLDETANHIKPLELIHLPLLKRSGFNIEANII